MSLIVAVARHGRTVLAADSGAWQERHATTLSEPKAFRVGRALVGLCGRAPVSHAVRYAVALPEPEDGEEVPRYVLGRLVPAMREAAETAPAKDGPAWGDLGGLIALDGWLFDLCNGTACVLLRSGEEGAFARGGPEDFARGVFAAADALAPDTDAESLCRLALQIAAEVSDACLPPFTVLHAEEAYRLRRTA